jgi:hypothetical protein
MEKTKKPFYKIFIFILGILAVITGYFFYQSKLQPVRKTAVQQNLTVYYKLSSQKDFVKGEVNSGKTALELTKGVARVVTKGDGAAAYVTEINGIVASDAKKEYWAFYINGKMAEVGAGSYILKNGDKIEWKIEKY